MKRLSDQQRDALLEIFNIGVGNAASSMSQLINEKISLSVPKLQILLEDSSTILNNFIRADKVCAVSQDFTGTLNAKAFLVFPEGKTQEIVRLMLGESVSTEELNTMEAEALTEIGNIILNSCLSAMSDMLQAEFQSTLPQYHLGTPNEVFPVVEGTQPFMLLLHIDFSMPSQKIDGYLVFMLNVESFNQLTHKVDQFLAGI